MQKISLSEIAPPQSGQYKPNNGFLWERSAVTVLELNEEPHLRQKRSLGKTVFPHLSQRISGIYDILLASECSSILIQRQFELFTSSRHSFL
jgi:hypothetical protein